MSPVLLAVLNKIRTLKVPAWTLLVALLVGLLAGYKLHKPPTEYKYKDHLVEDTVSKQRLSEALQTIQTQSTALEVAQQTITELQTKKVTTTHTVKKPDGTTTTDTTTETDTTKTTDNTKKTDAGSTNTKTTDTQKTVDTQTQTHVDDTKSVIKTIAPQRIHGYLAGVFGTDLTNPLKTADMSILVVGGVTYSLITVGPISWNVGLQLTVPVRPSASTQVAATTGLSF